MLPFTKRPGKGEESDVVVKDEIAAKSSPSVVPPASSSRPTTMRPPGSMAGPPASSPRGGEDFDDEMTGLVSSRALHSSFPAPLPAAGRPVTVPPSSRRAAPSIRPTAGGPASMRPPPSSARASFEADEDEDAEDEDGGRTVVRPEGSARKVVRRTASGRSEPRTTPSANPTSISPAAVIRKTMESQRAATRGLMSGPPSDLRGDLDSEDNDDFTQAAPSRAPASSQRSGAQRSNYPSPISYEGPPSHRPPAREPSTKASAQSYRHMHDSMDDASQSSPRSFAPRAHESGPIDAPAYSSRRNFEGPPSMPPPAATSRPGHFVHASAPPSNPAPQYSSPPNGVNPHGATHAMAAVPSAMGSNPYNTMPAGSNPVSVAPPAANPAMPAHFRMAQTGAIMPHMDPPGTAVTSNNQRMSGRPAMSWAAALAACGVFVGVVAVAIAQRGDGMADTQASFVDPAHTGKTVATQPVETQQAPTNPLPPGLIGASPVPAAAPPVAPVAPVPGMADPNLGLTAPQPQAQPAQPAPPAPADKVAATPKPAKPTFGGGAVVRRPPPPPRDTDEGDAPVKPKKPKGGDADEETRKALEELRKAQMERGL